MTILALSPPARKGTFHESASQQCNAGPHHLENWAKPIPGAELTTKQYVHAASLRLIQAGLSIIPIDAEGGSKAPDTKRLPRPMNQHNDVRHPSWHAFTIRPALHTELDQWQERQGDYGLAVVCGTVSGVMDGVGLEVIDFDTITLTQPWLDAVNKQSPGLIDRLVRIQSPRPGLHVYYRCARYGSSQKLACAMVKDDFGNMICGANGQPKVKTTVPARRNTFSIALVYKHDQPTNRLGFMG